MLSSLRALFYSLLEIGAIRMAFASALLLGIVYGVKLWKKKD